ncbi:sugar transferase [Tumebacillus flagellatus]|uniref:Bacterial sugar transferase domain-containing protein n=1 Tax=Tumebacillus flagellatus TaxID=1157490 RepID=A0A074M4S9_9BACL|nr:sugar transferase [Tumebacillus flagellatus]KEO81012.1 hypothetical protein EL26_23005 [Tumebacillus flagellatus]
MRGLGWIGVDGVVLFVLVKDVLDMDVALAFLIGVWWMLAYLLNLYQSLGQKTIFELTVGVGTTAVLHGVLWCLFASLDGISAGTVGLLLVGHALLQLALKIGSWLLVRWWQDAERAVVIAGDAAEGQAMYEQIRSDLRRKIADVQVLVVPQDSAAFLREPYQILYVGKKVPWPLQQEFAERAILAGKEVQRVPHPHDLAATGWRVSRMGEWMTVQSVPPSAQALRNFWKRGFDLAGAALMLLVFSPMMLACLILIPLTSSGPAIYAQQRVGLLGREYPIYKFRTMVFDAEKSTGPVLAQTRDPRITPIGRILRSTRLDELPQLINILKGEMSLIGPRPERPEFVKQYEVTIPGYPLRHLVRPGLSGYAQLMGGYATDTEEKLRCDLWYVNHYSLWLDLKILLQTVYVVSRPARAEGVKEAHGPKSAMGVKDL